MCHRSSVLPATIILLVIFYLQCLRLAPVSIFFSVAHTHTIACIVSIYKSITNQDAVVIRRYPEYSIIMICIKWVIHMHRFAPLTITVPFGIPNVLGVSDRIIFCIVWMVFANKK